MDRMRLDIEEGSDFRRIPRLCSGRILSLPLIDERYVHLRIGRFGFLLASGRYGALFGNDLRRKWRFRRYEWTETTK